MFEFAGCQFDPARVELRRDGLVVPVSAAVSAALAHLIAQRPHAVPARDLAAAAGVHPESVERLILAARSAIGDDPGTPALVLSIPGEGFRFGGTVTTTEPPAEPTHGAPTPASAAPDQVIRYCHSSTGVRIAYAISGSGPPLVKAANWLTNVDLELNSPIWAHWIGALSERHRLVRYDERGCGLSDRDVDRFDLDTWVEDLELVVDRVGLDRFPLVALSQGCAVAITYAVRHPERVTRLVLINGYARGRLVRARTPDEREEAALDLQLGRVAWRRDDPAYRQVFAAQFLPDEARDMWDAFNALQRATTSTENVVRFLDAFANVDVSELAPRVSCPTLVLHARRDHRVPAAQARELASLIPDSTLHLLDSANHITLAHEPAWPELEGVLHRFLDADPAPPSALASAPPVAPAPPPAAGPRLTAVPDTDGPQTIGPARQLSIRTLGGLRIEVDGVPLRSADFGYAKPRELLCYLLDREDASKAQIGAALWPWASAAALRGSFHSTVHGARAALGPGRIVYADGRYRFGRELPYRYDVEEFERHLRAAELGADVVSELRAAVGLWRGDYLADLGDDDWISERRAQLQRAYERALTTLGGQLAAAGRSADAVEILNRAVEQNPLNESAHRDLMRSYVAAGQRGRALQHYRSVTRLLRAELNTAPAAETVELYEQLRREQA